DRVRFPWDDFWFDLAHLREFARVLKAVDEEVPPRLQPFFRTVLGSTVRAFSFQDHGQIKVKRDPRKVLNGTPSPTALLATKLPAAVDKLAEFIRLLPGEAGAATSICESADVYAAGAARESVDVIVTSPPYINAMNYAMATRPELLLLNLVSAEALIAHQERYFGSERVYARDYSL